MLASSFRAEPGFLNSFGWSGFFENQLAQFDDDSLRLARVVGEEKSLYRLQFAKDVVLPGSVSGKKRHDSLTRTDLPAVGDWVLCQISAEIAVIHHVLDRKSVIARKTVGAKSDAQILATNVDNFFIASSLNEDLNYRRLERYLTIGWDSGAVPVILLTKADLVENPEAKADQVRAQFPGVDVIALTAKDQQTLARLLPYIGVGTTSVVAGSSGVGKSTLTNLLLGEELLLTQEIREEDGRGRHTTTSRYLFASPHGGLLIDTPGMRELQLLDHESGLSQQFEDVEQIASGCRFSDCAHASEPGCAIRAALADGELDEGRWASYVKLQKEIRFSQRKMDKALAAQEKAKWKKIHKEAEERARLKKRQS